MQSKDVLVRLQALDGVWEVGGVDRKRGIVPELGDLVADEWGPLEATFDLRRDTRMPWPDLGAFTPVEIEIGGVLIWSGFISETPTQGDRLMSVKCKGWQAHLDDDQYEPFYVHNRLGDWKDARSWLGQNLAAPDGFIAAGQVQAGSGVLLLEFPKDASVENFVKAGAVLDLGPGRAGKRVVVTWESSNNDGTSSRLVVYGFDGQDTSGAPGITADSSSVQRVNNAGTSGTDSVTFNVARRYLLVAIENNGTATRTLGADIFFRVTSLQVFADTAYESGNASVLKVPTVIGDALDRATVLLSDDRTGIDPDGLATFALPSFAPSDPQTPREVWAAVNALYDWRSAIDVNRRAVFEGKATAPVFEVGEWSPFELADSSANSGDEIYNRVIVTGQTPDGAPVRVRRIASEQPGAIAFSVTSPAPTNPSFTVDTSGWTATDSVITRDTTVFSSTPAAGRWDKTGASDDLGFLGVETLTGTFAGTFRRGITYRLDFNLWNHFGGTIIRPTFGDIAAGDFNTIECFLLGLRWNPLSIFWTPRADTSSVVLHLAEKPNFGGSFYRIDSLALNVSKGTLVDRRGFQRTKRLPISMPLPADGVLANRIGDKWLSGHKLTPFKGDTTIVGDHAVREILTGRNVPLERLLLATTGLLRFSDRPDPDTGAHGRDGRLTKVIYNHPRNDAKISIDNTRTSFEALVGRLSAVISG